MGIRLMIRKVKMVEEIKYIVEEENVCFLWLMFIDIMGIIKNVEVFVS